MAALADMILEVFVMESAVLRAEKIAQRPGAAPASVAIAAVLARLYAAKAMDTVELAARKVVAAVAEGDPLRDTHGDSAAAGEARSPGHGFAGGGRRPGTW